MKLLIAYDGSDYADAALDDLRHAGLPEIAEVQVLTASPLPYLAVPAACRYDLPDRVNITDLNDRQLSNAQALATVAADRLRADFPQWHIDAEGLLDRAASGIVGRAAAWDPDLIVVGPHGLSGVCRVLLGKVPQHVLTHASCSVRIGRASSLAQNQPLQLLVGTDGSPHAGAALRAIAARQWPSGTQVRIVTVLDSRSLIFESRAEGFQSMLQLPLTVEELRSRISDTIQQAVRFLNDCGLVATAEILAGDPCDALVNEAKQSNADCIFVGARGLNAIERIALGSVSTAVAARAQCSVEVVRQPGYTGEMKVSGS